VSNHRQRDKTDIFAENGVAFGCVLAIVISYVKWHSIAWTYVHAVFGCR
jgi:hypothetical protein